ncbi:MAG TPA: Ig-like domain-containing protein [Solirubrobacteraceae bacterium]|nr:Ig-like domain-containing protein [Solirubrobacteraceae bacterium]
MAILALAVPGSALAGTYTWDLASNFTSTAPGANPDHDPYGATPWSYLGGASTSIDPSTFAPLSPFVSSPNGLTAWSTAGAAPLVGINPTEGTVTDLGATVPPHQVFVEPGSAQVVAVGWTSPLTQTETVSINGSITSDAPGPGPCGVAATTWSVDQNAAPLSGASGSNTGSFTTTATVAPGGSIYLTVSTDPTDAACDATGVSLHIEAGGAAPAVAVTTPVSGTSSTVDDPTFSGVAGSDFGDGSQVTLRVYAGHVVSGSPVETVTVPRSGASWSTNLPTPLPLGTYTVQAEQDDVASPPDVGLSAPATFTVAVPAIFLDSPGAKPLTTSTPTLTGTADNDAGSDPFAVVELFRGDNATGSPVAKVSTSVAASGRFSVQVTPALPDGTYTAVAAQADHAGATGVSAPQTFDIDTRPPPVTLVRPGTGSRANFLQLLFAGAAGNASFDARVVTVTLYRGKKASGKPVGTTRATVTGSTWSAKWPRSLAPGTYTAVASQGDVVGHVGRSPAHTFRVLPLPPVIGAQATFSRAGRVSVVIACNESAGDTCSGTVLVLTRGEFQPLAGGPVGHLTVMFAYVHIPGGQTRSITRTVLPSVAAVLRRHAGVGVTISASLRPIRGKPIHARAQANLRRA